MIYYDKHRYSIVIMHVAVIELLAIDSIITMMFHTMLIHNTNIIIKKEIITIAIILLLYLIL